jgi:periplasmic copper chaperone A
MHRVARSAIIGLVGMFVLVAAASSISAGQKGPTASSGWVKLPEPGATTTTGFVFVENPTMYAIYLLSASADVAGKVEMRQGAKPDPVAEVTVPAYGSIDMDPKGLHLVLSDLKRPLKEGDTVVLTVTTEVGTKLQVDAPVKKE